MNGFQANGFQANAFQVESGVPGGIAYVEDVNYLIAKSAPTSVALAARDFVLRYAPSWLVKKKEPQQ
jgi:hypothetical protein